jgi:tetratricopeptide (TPR) repeat protein
MFDTQIWEEVGRFDQLGRFSTDGQLLAMYTNSTSIALMEVATRRELCRLDDPGGEIPFHVWFAPDNVRLYTVVPSGLRVWDLALIRCQLAERGLDWEGPPHGESSGFRTQNSEFRHRRSPRVQFDLGDFERMRPRVLEENLNRAIQAAPDQSVRWRARGKCHFEAGRYAQALQDMRECVKKEDPTNTRRLARFCDELARMCVTVPEEFRNADEGIAVAERAVKREGEWGYYNTLGIAYYRAGRYQDALAALEKCLANNAGQTDGQDLYFLAMCHHRLGAPDKAKDCLERAIAWHESHKPELLDKRDRDPQAKETLRELESFRAEAEESLQALKGNPPREG